jgi:hypothetical protein
MPPRPDAVRFPDMLGTWLAQRELDAVRKDVADALSRFDDDRARYGAVLVEVADGLVGLLTSGNNLDVDSTIEHLLELEQEDQEHAKALEQKAEWLFRRFKAQPELMPLINDVVRASLRGIEEMATLHRDQRWRLMMARAMHQPSAGKGAVHGSPTDADAFLKTRA